MSNLEFIEDTHQYLYDGVLVPCVSDIIKFKFPDLYANIPEYVLSKKAAYGTKCHEAVEKYLLGQLTIEETQFSRMDPNIKVSLKQVEKLRKTAAFTVQNIECAVCYEGKFAGTYDILTSENYLIDIKTTATLHIDNDTLNAPLNLQISLYYLALGIEKDIGYVLWLPKGGSACLKEVKTWSKKDLLELLENYEKEHNSK